MNTSKRESLYKEKNIELKLESIHDYISKGQSDSAAALVLERFNLIIKYDGSDEDLFQQMIDEFIQCYISIMSKKEFNPKRSFKESLLKISSLVSCFFNYRTGGNFDSILINLVHNNFPVYKILSFYSIFSDVKLPLEKISQEANEIFSLWFFSYLSSYEEVMTSKNLSEKFSLLLSNLPYISCLSNDSHIMYFLISYYDVHNEKVFKEWFNQRVRRCSPLSSLSRKEKLKSRRRKKIAICSQYWFSGHSVYRSQSLYLESLAETCDLYLIYKDCNDSKSLENNFIGAMPFSLENWERDAHEILAHDFDMIYFPEVGLTLESIFLANARFAPIQLSSYGHPASTWGAEIDYWIGGQRVENTQHCAEHYSERLVLLPGLGVLPSFPKYERQNPQREEECIYINCLWGGLKYNYSLLECLQDVIRRSTRKICFRFFPGGTAKKYKIWTLKKRLKDIFSEDDICVYSELGYQDYMRILEKSHFSIDSYPFGGYNSIIDSLHCAVPVISWEANHFRNRAASALLRMLSMEELIAESQEGYVNLILHMIEDKDFLEKQRQKINQCDYLSILHGVDQAKDFAGAIHYLFDHHESLKLDDHNNPIVWNEVKGKS